MNSENIKDEQIKELERIIMSINGDYMLNFCKIKYAYFSLVSPIKHKAIFCEENLSSYDLQHLNKLELTDIGSTVDIKDNTVDVIVLVHHLSCCKKYVAVLNEAHRILSASGKLIILESNPLSRLGISFLFSRAIKEKKYRFNFLSRFLLSIHLDNAEFSIDSIRNLNHKNKPNNFFAKTLYKLCSLLNVFNKCDSYIVIASKITPARSNISLKEKINKYNPFKVLSPIHKSSREFN